MSHASVANRGNSQKVLQGIGISARSVWKMIFPWKTIVSVIAISEDVADVAAFPAPSPQKGHRGTTKLKSVATACKLGRSFKPTLKLKDLKP